MIDYNVGVSISDNYYIKQVDTHYFEGDVVYFLILNRITFLLAAR